MPRLRLPHHGIARALPPLLALEFISERREAQHDLVGRAVQRVLDLTSDRLLLVRHAVLGRAFSCVDSCRHLTSLVQTAVEVSSGLSKGLRNHQLERAAIEAIVASTQLVPCR